jgi:hypothetical protein
MLFYNRIDWLGCETGARVSMSCVISTLCQVEIIEIWDDILVLAVLATAWVSTSLKRAWKLFISVV